MCIYFLERRRRLKLLFYDGSGLVLITKRIERGRFMNLAELIDRNEIKLSELKQIFHGSVIRSPVLDRSMAASNTTTQRESFALPLGVHSSL